MSILEFHRVGGMPFMAPLTLILLANLAIIVFVSLRTAANKPFHRNWLKVIKQVGGFALAFGVVSTIIGLFFALRALSESPEVIPFNVIMGGLAVGLITAIYGLCIFLVSLAAGMILQHINSENK